jgi:tripartite ATP-independent transporter DctM subunit
MTVLIAFGVIALALLGAPLFIVFGAAAILLFARLPDTPLSGAANDVFSDRFADSPILVTIPLFTMAGVLLAEAGASRRLVAVSRALFGWMPGGLGLVCLIASAVFTTFTGGSGITIVAVGALLFPALVEERYPERFSLGLVTVGGSLGLLFPPSLPIIIYGIVASIDIQSLFIAAFLPGLVTLMLLSLYGSIYFTRARVPRTPFAGKAALTALWHAKWEAALPVVLVSGLASGVLRIHEAAAFTALYVLLIELFIYKDLTFRDIPRIARKCVTLVGAILIILATAVGFTSYLIQAAVPQAVLAAMQTFISSKWTFLLVLNAFLLIVGMLMDIFSAIIVVVPLIVPLAQHFGVNPYHLGTVFLLNLEIGYLTPPVGINLFLSSFRFERPMAEIYRAVVPFIAVLLGALLVVTYVPALSTWSGRLVEPLTLELVQAKNGNTPDATKQSGPSNRGSPPPSSESLEDLSAAAATPERPRSEPEHNRETLDDLLGDAGAPDHDQFAGRP